ncbi:4'-phosphopantetheinyl transferase superfamily protein [Aquamicrobium sp. LC103]|uniref:4'-phosphopantetheinyl transferase family protein n=1 Tax=Aquamicrobium sp. LC103 TaxID=1120658 RepID=UPI00063E703A|nr:4'-phosphopantetheinyl transferase superfamily protein [Aquamicrobium sp. LC103]
MSFFEDIAESEIHLHMVDEAEIAQNRLDSYREVMSDDEHQRCDRFHFERNRRQFTITRALLRFTLSQYVPGVAPRDWRFTRNGHGRPAIANEIGQALDFNLSHTTGRAVISVSRSTFVGVDIEWRGREIESADLARHFFAAEETADLPDVAVARDRRFFMLWTLKEAYVKALGRGLSIPLDSFCIGFPEEDAISLRVDDPPDAPFGWRLWTLDAGGDYALSVAAKAAEPWRLRLFRSVPMSIAQEIECHILRSL